MRETGRPFVIANFAMSADGKISTRNRTPALFTSAHDKARLLKIRAMGDAVIAGRHTVETDTMSLGIPGRPPEKCPLRVLISESGKISPKWKVFHSPGGAIVIFTTPAISREARTALEAHPQATLHLAKTVRLPRVLKILRQQHGVRKLVCEGGPRLFRSLLEIGALDQLRVTIAPRLFGGAAAPTLTGVSTHFLRSIPAFRLTRCEVI
ncbi:MAG TPA: RibD family protein, partial [Chthoniobacterales bacterium]